MNETGIVSLIILGVLAVLVSFWGNWLLEKIEDAKQGSNE